MDGVWRVGLLIRTWPVLVPADGDGTEPRPAPRNDLQL